MQSLNAFNHSGIKYIFTDIDGTLTTDGRISSESYDSLWKLKKRGLCVIPITGRPAGWCDLIARFWPVHGVIGENGALYFSHQNEKMKRYYFCDRDQRRINHKKLRKIALEVREQVPASKISADQFTRLFDLAIDFAEDIQPLSSTQIKKIVNVFEKHGAIAKVSNIHVNGWFGDYDKLRTCQLYCAKELGFNLKDNLDQCAFIGDSPNDEPMFKFFKWSFAVANIESFLPDLKSKPKFVSSLKEGLGFNEIIEKIM